MNEHPSEEYIKGISGVKIIINEDLSDDEIMVSPRVYKKMKNDLKGEPVGYSPKQDEDFQKMLDELGEVPFDLTPPSHCILEPIKLEAPKLNLEHKFKEVMIRKTLEKALENVGYGYYDNR